MWLSVVVCVLAAVTVTVTASSIPPSAIISTPNQHFQSLLAQPGMMSASLKDAHNDPTPLKLTVPTDPFGCSPEPAPFGSDVAVLVLRGNCNFTSKALFAAQSNAGAVIVANSLPGLYGAASDSAAPPAKRLNTTSCDFDCSVGSGWVPQSDVSTAEAYKGYNCSSACPSQCVLTGATQPNPTTGAPPLHQVCCATNDYVEMAASQAVDIPVVFVPLSGGKTLTAFLDWAASSRAAPIVTVASRHIPTVDTSSVLIWVLGCVAAGLSAYRAAALERAQANARDLPSAPSTLPDAAIESVHIDAKTVVLFLCVASTVLVSLFFLIKLGVSVVMIVTVIFMLGSLSAVSYILLQPLIHAAAPRLANKSIPVKHFGNVPAYVFPAAPIAVAIVLWWFFERHASYAFVPQNVFGLCLCCMFLLQIRLPNIKVATLALVLFFLYDIFMVFLSPYFFGSSVMVGVATAGLPKAIANAECYCRLHPGDTTYCGPGEAMPILFRLPRLDDYRGGYAMLGLGDIVLPGLLLSYAARHDYSTARSLRRGYFWTSWAGYCVGLAMANVAVNLMKQGQPALLYLVPCILIPFCILARCRDELHDMWHGPPCADDDDEESGAMDVPLTRDAGGENGTEVEMSSLLRPDTPHDD